MRSSTRPTLAELRSEYERTYNSTSPTAPWMHHARRTLWWCGGRALVCWCSLDLLRTLRNLNPGCKRQTKRGAGSRSQSTFTGPHRVEMKTGVPVSLTRRTDKDGWSICDTRSVTHTPACPLLITCPTSTWLRHLRTPMNPSDTRAVTHTPLDAHPSPRGGRFATHVWRSPPAKPFAARPTTRAHPPAHPRHPAHLWRVGQQQLRAVWSGCVHSSHRRCGRKGFVGSMSKLHLLCVSRADVGGTHEPCSACEFLKPPCAACPPV